MSWGRLVFGTFQDLIVRPDFLPWLSCVSGELLIPESYFNPSLAKLPFVRQVPDGILDRNEILLMPPRMGPGPMSLSWSMPLCLATTPDGLRILMRRGASNCATCFYQSEKPGGCRKFNTDLQADQAMRDLGGCPEWREAAFLDGPLKIYTMAVWWRDTDWPLTVNRYYPAAYAPDVVKRLAESGQDILLGRISAKEAFEGLRDCPPLRGEIPPTLQELAGRPRRAPANKASWMAALWEWTLTMPDRDAFLDQAREREYCPC